MILLKSYPEVTYKIKETTKGCKIKIEFTSTVSESIVNRVVLQWRGFTDRELRFSSFLYCSSSPISSSPPTPLSRQGRGMVTRSLDESRSLVRVDVSARNPGKVQAALTETRRGLSELILEPLREEQYYEVREPFSPMSLVKSPMGLMVGFMLLVVFLMPKLMENMDPEEMRRAQEEMRSQGVPSLASLLPGAARN
ncbi:ER membrane protein complex subunit 7-like protein [Drosera capensis]